MEIKQIRITPPMAREWLKKNTSNRPMRRAKVEGYKSAFSRGEYRLTHQGIAFSTAGILLDGQHRLTAISEMPDNFAIEMVVARGLPADAFDVIDTSLTPRSASDVLRKSQGCTAVARFLAAKLMDSARGAAITPVFLRPYVDAVEPAYDDLIDYCPTVSKTWSAAAIRAAAILRIMGGGDRDYVLLSYHALNHADFDSMSPIVQALYRQQIRGTVNTHSLDIFARAFRAFDFKKQSVPTIQISDQSRIVTEARDLVQAYVLGQRKAATSAAKKVNKVNSKSLALI